MQTLPALLLATLILVLGGFALTSQPFESKALAQSPPPGNGQRPAPKKTPGPFVDWNLDEVDARFRPGLAKIQEHEYKLAASTFDDLGKLRGDDRLDRAEKKRAKFLEELAEDLETANKLVGTSKFTHKQLMGLRAVTSKYRESFAYPYFQRLEDLYRGSGTKPIQMFEPPLLSYEPLTEPLDPFAKVEYQTVVPLPVDSAMSRKPEEVRQGLYSYAFRDSPENRTLGAAIHCETTDWSDSRYLCVSMRLADPKRARVEIYLRDSKKPGSYYKLGVGSWSGWKDFRLDFRKIAAESRRGGESTAVSWERIDTISFSTVGGVSDLFIDDVFLCD